ALRWLHAPFEVPADILAAWRAAGARGTDARTAWEQRLTTIPAADREELTRRLENRLPTEFSSAVQGFKRRLVETGAAVASRKSSEMALEVLTEAVPELLGGSADLTHSNLTVTKHTPSVSASNFGGRYLHYGVREHAMGAFMNGVAVHGGFIPYGGTFLVFADYCRPAIRLSALMGLPVVYVMTHDSIGLGEDGPTHQPVEHLASLRAIPNLVVLRPADAVETAESWQVALERKDGPTLLALSRQNLAPVRTSHLDENLVALGAYLVAGDGPRDVTLIGTGAEVQLALAARDLLQADGIRAAVVSMPSMELFERQDDVYRARVLGTAPRIAVEAASSWGWTRYVASEADFIGMGGFGASAPAKELFEHFGITPEAVAARARERVSRLQAA
ncbi:MAG: transketolase C-terminal domain-containing protein, partial [Geminicoccaceae bacterium]